MYIRLIDKSLKGIDPRDPNLSIETKRKIMVECKRNFMYFVKVVMNKPTDTP